MKIDINPAFRSLIPPLSDQERFGLERSILAEGCRDAVVVWRHNGSATLLDGHNRLTICGLHKIKYQIHEQEIKDEAEAKIWIIRNQFNRRNLSDLSKIELALKLEDELRKQSKENQVRKPESVRAKLPRQKDTRATLAATAQLSERTFDAGKLILEQGDEKTIAEVRSGKKAIHRAAKEIKERTQRSSREAKRVESAKGADLDQRIIVGDFRKKHDAIPDGSIPLIFTDPPYDREALKLIDDLGKFAASKLSEGGSLLCYVGQIQIPKALELLSRHLRYWWTIACVHSGGETMMREYGIRAGWKAVLWFVKGTRHDNSVFVSDLMSGGREKAFHDWQQSEAEAGYWIEKLCSKDGMVCDPFLGGGTTAAAANRLGRKWVGFEVDDATAKVASSRVSK